MFAQYPGLKSSCRSLWAGLPFPLAVTFGRRRAVHSFGSVPQAERLAKLNAIAISQMKVLTEDHRMLQFDEAKETES